jgi:hypothetical protein
MARINDIVISEMAFNAMVRKMHNQINQPAERLLELYKHNEYSDQNIAKVRRKNREKNKIQQLKLELKILQKEKLEKRKIWEWLENDIVNHLSENKSNQLLLRYDKTYKIKDFNDENKEFFNWSYLTKQQKTIYKYQKELNEYIKKCSHSAFWKNIEDPSIIYEKYGGNIRCYLYNKFDFIKELEPFKFSY